MSKEEKYVSAYSLTIVCLDSNDNEEHRDYFFCDQIKGDGHGGIKFLTPIPNDCLQNVGCIPASRYPSVKRGDLILNIGIELYKSPDYEVLEIFIANVLRLYIRGKSIYTRVQDVIKVSTAFSVDTTSVTGNNDPGDGEKSGSVVPFKSKE